MHVIELAYPKSPTWIAP